MALTRYLFAVSLGLSAAALVACGSTPDPVFGGSGGEGGEGGANVTSSTGRGGGGGQGGDFGCNANQFTCDSGICIAALRKCDQKADCVDGSDEAPSLCQPGAGGMGGGASSSSSSSSSSGGGPTCTDTQFECASGQCIFDTQQCDGTKNCPDNSDEAPINAACNPPAGWTCSASYWRDGDCDCGCGVVDYDCADATVAACDFCSGTGSCNGASGCPGKIKADDNAHCTTTCSSSQFTCNSGACVSGTKRCDGTADCTDGSDELPASCAPAGWTCKASDYFDTFCDCGCGITDPACASKDLSACLTCSLSGSCSSQACSGNTQIIPTDNAHCIATCAGKFTCGNGSCVESSRLCDKANDCGDGSDEYPKNATCAAPTWTCPADWLTDDRCDCGCGALDPACADATVASCEDCLGTNGGCNTGVTCPGTIKPDQNWLCK